MKYADFEFYSEIYCGTDIPKEEFAHFELKAVAEINAFINADKEGFEAAEELKLCICEICDILYDTNFHEGINYERNDGYWVSYDKERTKEGRIRSCVHKYLGKSGLLYRGR